VILSQSNIKILKWYKAMGVDEIYSNTTRTYIKKNQESKITTKKLFQCSSENDEIYILHYNLILN
jgi:hypothetical protein